MPFKKGFDPNRNIKGRPPNSYGASTILQRQLKETVIDKTTGIALTKRKMLFDKLFELVMKGDMAAIKLYMEYAYGKPMIQIEAEVYKSPIPTINIISDIASRIIEEEEDTIEAEAEIVNGK